MKIKAYLPHILTLSNLFLGALAVVSLLAGRPLEACWLVLGAALADFFDGAVARMLDVSSPLGKELDSLADVISFGLVPGVMLYQMIAKSYGVEMPAQEVFGPAIPAFLLSAFSGLRLGKFNLDIRQTSGFIGLPTPASTIFVMGLLLMVELDSFGLASWILTPWLLYALTVVFSLLLIAELPMFSLKFAHLNWKGNEIRYIFVLASVALLLWLQLAAPAFIVVLYLLLSLIHNQVRTT